VKIIHLDLAIYPLVLVEKGISAYQHIADISAKQVDDGHITLDVVSRSHCDDALLVDEFLNYLIALAARASGQL
jgi:hypothetical protein